MDLPPQSPIMPDDSIRTHAMVKEDTTILGIGPTIIADLISSPTSSAQIPVEQVSDLPTPLLQQEESFIIARRSTRRNKSTNIETLKSNAASMTTGLLVCGMKTTAVDSTVLTDSYDLLSSTPLTNQYPTTFMTSNFTTPSATHPKDSYVRLLPTKECFYFSKTDQCLAGTRKYPTDSSGICASPRLYQNDEVSTKTSIADKFTYALRDISTDPVEFLFGIQTNSPHGNEPTFQPVCRVLFPGHRNNTIPDTVQIQFPGPIDHRPTRRCPN